MKNLHNRSFLPSILSLFLLITACHSTLEPDMVPYNSQLDGSWEVQSYMISGEEQMGYTLAEFDIIFIPEEASSGMSKWHWSVADGSSSSEDNFYTLSADGETILLTGKEYQMELDEQSLILRCEEDLSACEIRARRQ